MDGQPKLLDGEGRKNISDEFRSLVFDRYGLSTDKWSRNLLAHFVAHVRIHAPEREVHQFATYDEEDGELFLSDFDAGYYVLDGQISSIVRTDKMSSSSRRTRPHTNISRRVNGAILPRIFLENGQFGWGTETGYIEC